MRLLYGYHTATRKTQGFSSAASQGGFFGVGLMGPMGPMGVGRLNGLAVARTVAVALAEAVAVGLLFRKDVFFWATSTHFLKHVP